MIELLSVVRDTANLARESARFSGDMAECAENMASIIRSTVPYDESLFRGVHREGDSPSSSPRAAAKRMSNAPVLGAAPAIASTASPKSHSTPTSSTDRARASDAPSGVSSVAMPRLPQAKLASPSPQSQAGRDGKPPSGKASATTLPQIQKDRRGDASPGQGSPRQGSPRTGTGHTGRFGPGSPSAGAASASSPLASPSSSLRGGRGTAATKPADEPIDSTYKKAVQDRRDKVGAAGSKSSPATASDASLFFSLTSVTVAEDRVDDEVKEQAQGSLRGTPSVAPDAAANFASAPAAATTFVQTPEASRPKSAPKSATPGASAPAPIPVKVAKPEVDLL